jgi:protocatechuate 3,4-dioxygenase beta subunit
MRFVQAIASSLTIASALWASGAVALADVATADIAPASRTAQQIVRDVALQASRTLHGSVVDSRGMPQANCEVWLTAADEPAAQQKLRTDATGRFRVTDLSPGVYRIDTATSGGKFRVWDAKDAPRDAQSSVLLVVYPQG